MVCSNLHGLRPARSQLSACYQSPQRDSPEENTLIPSNVTCSTSVKILQPQRHHFSRNMCIVELRKRALHRLSVPQAPSPRVKRPQPPGSDLLTLLPDVLVLLWLQRTIHYCSTARTCHTICYNEYDRPDATQSRHTPYRATCTACHAGCTQTLNSVI